MTPSPAVRSHQLIPVLVLSECHEAIEVAVELRRVARQTVAEVRDAVERNRAIREESQRLRDERLRGRDG
jgi:hypothetical protein